MARVNNKTEGLAAVATAALLVFYMVDQFRPKRSTALAAPRGNGPSRDAGGSTESPDRAAKSAQEPAQSGRGRHSVRPWDIPWAGWKDILVRTYRSIDEDRLLATAGGVVFFGLLAVFPAITALVSCYGLFADPSTITDNLQSLAVMLPQGSFQIVQDQVNRVLSKGQTSLGFAFLFGLGLAIWSANAGVKAVIDALNVMYGETEKRGFFKLNGLALLFTTGTIAALMLMVGAVVALPLALDHLWLGNEIKVLLSLARWPLLVVMLLVALAVLYRYGPSRRSPRWEWLSVGAITAALLWLVGSSLLSWYLSNFANYDATYGSLGAAIGLMTWMWMSAIIVLCGAELNSEIEHQTAKDTTVGSGKPLGARGAAMADSVGAAQT